VLVFSVIAVCFWVIWKQTLDRRRAHLAAEHRASVGISSVRAPRMWAALVWLVIAEHNSLRPKTWTMLVHRFHVDQHTSFTPFGATAILQLDI
jgi:hypothetical protein